MTDDGNAFWGFSLTIYRKPDVPTQCLQLQDKYGADVNVVLYLLFRADSGTFLSREQIAQLDGLVQDWRRDVVQTLRAARRALKRVEIGAIAADDGGLRQRVKQIELEAERLQQHALARCGASLGAGEASSHEAARVSLRAYADHLGSGLPELTLDRFLATVNLPNL